MELTENYLEYIDEIPGPLLMIPAAAVGGYAAGRAAKILYCKKKYGKDTKTLFRTDCNYYS